MKNRRTSSTHRAQRTFGVINFFAFNLLFFALYLNFIHQDANAVPASQSVHSNYKGTSFLTNNQEQVLQKATVNAGTSQAAYKSSIIRSLN